jgi:succinate dehydrogenase / fumarate reductase, membrane anchor subunit
MVTNVTSLTGNGLKDWLIQRVTAVYFGFYVLFLMGFIVNHPQLAYYQWQSLFACSWFKIATIMAFFAFVLHAWVGLWTVTTDYLKCTIARLLIQIAVASVLGAQLIWGVMIVWGQ